MLYEFKAPYDLLTKTVTYLVVSSISAIFAFISYLAVFEGDDIGISPILLAILYFLIVLLPYLFSPRSYVLTVKGVLIKRILRSILIPYEDLVCIKRIERTSIMRGLRIFGSGGLYGFFGLFHIQNLGRVWMYVTDRRKMLLIETKRGTKYAISPSDPSAFIERIKALVPWVRYQS